MEATHKQLWKLVVKLPSDFEPYGKRIRENGYGDCSCSCKWFHELEGIRGADWGICFNTKSPRKGLLTFEHMGCENYKYINDDEYLDTFLLFCGKCDKTTKHEIIHKKGLCKCGQINELTYSEDNYDIKEWKKNKEDIKQIKK